MNLSTQKLTRMGLLCAISVVLILFARFPFPLATFLIYEPGDVPIILGSFMFGPIAGLVMTIVVSLIQTTISGFKDGLVGALMHIIATGTLAMVCGFIYKNIRNKYSVGLSLILGSISMILIMIPANLFFDVKFYAMPYKTVINLIPAISLFNLIKSCVNSLLAFLLYLALNTHFKFGEKDAKNPQTNFK